MRFRNEGRPAQMPKAQGRVHSAGQGILPVGDEQAKRGEDTNQGQEG